MQSVAALSPGYRAVAEDGADGGGGVCAIIGQTRREARNAIGRRHAWASLPLCWRGGITRSSALKNWRWA